jgi:hypothetical protein
VRDRVIGKPETSLTTKKGELMYIGGGAIALLIIILLLVWLL